MDHNDNEQRLMTDIDSLAEQSQSLDGVYAPASLVPSVLSRLQPGNASVQPGMQGDQVERLMTALENSDWHVRTTAVRMLGELGERTPLEPLMAALNDEDESVRAAAVQALGKLGERAPIDRLVAALHDPEWAVREIAALTLGELGERAPAGPLLDILHAEDEDPYVRVAAKMALQQTHPAVLSPLVSGAVMTSQTQDPSPRETGGHLQERTRSYLTKLIGPFKSLSGRSVGERDGQEEDNLVEIPASDDGASPGSAPQQPVLARPKHHLALRIGEGVLAALLIAGLALSWLALAQRLHPSSPGSSSHPRQAPTPGPTVLPSEPGHNVSLTVVNGMVDVGSLDDSVYALRASDGGLLWRYQAAGPVGGPLGNPPLVVDGIVYVNANVDQGLGYLTGYIYALQASDGTLLWRYTTGNFVYMGYVYSPTVANGVVYVASQSGSLTALRASDGALLWRYTAKGQVAVSLAVNGIVYLLDTNIDHGPDYLEALRASDGKLLWRTPSYDYLPVVVNNVLYITSQAGLSALQARDGTLLWRYALAGTGFAGPTIFDGVVYAVAFKYSPDTTTSTPTAGYARLVTAPINWKIPFKQGGPSSLYALRASNGTVLWHYQTPGNKNTGIGVLAVAGGLVYIDTTADPNKNSFSALRATDGSLLWTHASDAPFNLPVVIGQGVFYFTSSSGVSDSGVVYALQARDGKELWRYAVNANVYNSPVLVGSTLYIGADNGVIYALDATNGSLRWYHVTYTGS